ncbi:MAG: histidine kinase dimerization/phosphoacceptor domain -containing protein [Balneolaceae bacterium]
MNPGRYILIFYVCSALLLSGVSWVVFVSLSASQTYISLHSLWSQSQQNALLHLVHYMNSGDEVQFSAFEESVQIVDDIQDVLYRAKGMPTTSDESIETIAGTLFTKNEIEQAMRMFWVLRMFGTHQLAFEEWADLHSKQELYVQLGAMARQQRASGDHEAALEMLLHNAEGLHITLTEEKLTVLQQIQDASGVLRFRAFFFIVFISAMLVIIGAFLHYRHRQSVSALNESYRERSKLAKFPELNQSPIIELSREGSVLYTNQAARDAFGIVDPNHPLLEPREELLGEAMRPGKSPVVRDVKVNDRMYTQLLHYIEEQQRFHIYAYDNTERHQFEEELQGTLHQKNMLLGELHHRVKNNLAVIAGFMELERMTIDDDEEMLRYGRVLSRIHAMAAVQEVMYSTQQLSDLELSEVLELLVGKYNPLWFSDVAVKSSAPCKVNLNQALPCAIIINEYLFELTRTEDEQWPVAPIEVEITSCGNGVTVTLYSESEFSEVLLSRVDEAFSNRLIVDTYLKQIGGRIDTILKKKKLVSLHFEQENKRGSSSALQPEEIDQVL